MPLKSTPNLQNSRIIVEEFLDHLFNIRHAITEDHYLRKLLTMEPDPVIRCLINETGCIGCGAKRFEEALMTDQEGLIYECTECPTQEERN